MTWYERWELKWMGIGTLLFAAILGVWLSWGTILGVLLSLTTIVSTVLLALSWKTNQLPFVMWNEQNGVLVILRSFSLEVLAGRLMTSVPIGLDLSHSASKVLRALHIRFDGKKKGEVRFFLCRPAGDGVTRAGILVARKGMRLLDGVKRAAAISEDLATDAMILESSLRAAYPHMPIERAGLEDLLLVTSGGVEPYAQVR
ncbi:MAG: hypothetical protein ACW985_10570 [Candidatus Thorarchaeota archaeon]